MMNTNKNKAVILLSGGLDSAVSLAAAQQEGILFELALTFDYGQKAFEKEYAASKELARFYNIPHKCIKLDWLKDITQNSLVTDKEVPDIDISMLDNIDKTIQTMKSVWVPNRNALFINIAASFADAKEYDYIVIGANSEEAATFSDNSQKFIDDMNEVLKTSTNYNIKVIAPLIGMDKNTIVKKAMELDVPLKHINSCYNSTKGHCGHCESCARLKRALQQNGCDKIIKELFLE